MSGITIRLLTAAAFLPSVVSAAEHTDWPTKGFDARRWNCPDGSSVPLDAKGLWRFAPDVPNGGFVSSPAVVGGKVYVGGNDGILYCLDAASGRKLWTFAARHIVFSSPVVVGGRVYFGEGQHTDDDCRLYCLDAVTGKLIWQLQTEGHTEGTPLVTGGKVYFSAGGDGFWCADAAGGKGIWRTGGFHPDGCPALVGGRIICGAGYEKPGIFALEADTGKHAWRHPVEGAAWGTPSVHGNHVIMGTGEQRFGERVRARAGTVVCLDVATGKPVWTLETPTAVLSAPVIVDDTAYVAAVGGRVYSLEADTGKPKWTVALRNSFFACPAWTGGGLVLAGQNGAVLLLNPEDGKVRKTWEISRQGFVGAPAVVGGRLYIAGQDGAVYCIGKP